MFNIGPGEMMMLALLALLLFGPKRLPEIGKAAGEAIASFRNASKEFSGEMQRQLAEENRTDRPAADSAPLAELPAGQVAEALADPLTTSEPTQELAVTEEAPPEPTVVAVEHEFEQHHPAPQRAL